MFSIKESRQTNYSCIEMCAGAGGQALGLHISGFQHKALIEIEPIACQTLELNNRLHNLGWQEIIQSDLRAFAKDSNQRFKRKVDLVGGGVPCPPFSKAGKQLEQND